MQLLSKHLSKPFERLEKEILDYLFKKKFLTSRSDYWGEPLKNVIQERDASPSSHFMYLFGQAPDDVVKAFSEIRVYSFAAGPGTTMGRQVFQFTGTTIGGGEGGESLAGHYWDGSHEYLIPSTGRTSLQLNTYYGQLAGTNDWTALNDFQANIKVGTTSPERHIYFNRAGYNYIAAPTSGVIAFLTNGRTATSENSVLELQEDDVWIGRGGLAIGKRSITLGYALDVDGKGIFQDDLTLSKATTILSFSSTTGIKTISTGGTTNLILAPGGDVGIDKSLGSTVFSSGFAGSGMRYDVPTTRLTVDNLTVRKQLRVYELLIEQIRANRGAIVVSPGDVIVDFVVGDKAYIDTGDDDRFPLSLVVNDLIRCQRWSGSGVKYYVAQVTETGSDTGGDYDGRYWFKWTILTPLEMDDVEEGDEAVVFGNTTDTDRQGVLYITASDDNAPYLDILDEVDSDDLTGKTKVRLGKLTGIVDASFGGALSGYGLYSDNVYLKGKLIVESGSDISAVDAIWPSDEGLEMYLALDEGTGTAAYDNSGNEITGTLSNSAGWVDEGIAGGMASFLRASDSRITHAEISFADNTAYTYSAWVKWDGTTPSNIVIPFGQLTSSSYSIYFANSSGVSYFNYRTTTDNTIVSTANMPDLYDGEAHHVVWTVDTARKVEVWVDGVAVGDSTLGATSAFIYSGVGKGHSTAGYAWNGWIDEPRIYSRTLSDVEIRGLYKHISKINANQATRTTIEGGLVTTGAIRFLDGDGNERAGITGAGTGTDIATWYGCSHADVLIDPTNASSRIDYNGKLFATGADISGKISAGEGDIAGFIIDTNEISKTDGLEKTILSSADQYLAFLYDGNERAKIGIDNITGLSTLISNSGQETENPAFSETHTTASGSFTNDSAQFTITENALIDLFCYLQYTHDPTATWTSQIRIWGDVILLDSSDVVIETIVSFDFEYDEIDDYTEWITVGKYLAAGTYKLRYDYDIRDDSVDVGAVAVPGTFELGGTSSEHRIEWYNSANHGSVIGQDGMYSFWGNTYFYANPTGFATHTFGVPIWHLAIKGNMKFTAGGSVSADFAYNGIELQGTQVILSGDYIEAPNLPTSSSGLEYGQLWVDSNNFVKRAT